MKKIKVSRIEKIRWTLLSLTAFATIVPSIRLFSFMQLCLLYGARAVNLHHLTIAGTSQMGLRVSNGDLLSPNQITVNFLGTALVWLVMLICVYGLIIQTIIRWLLPKTHKELIKDSHFKKD